MSKIVGILRVVFFLNDNRVSKKNELTLTFWLHIAIPNQNENQLVFFFFENRLIPYSKYFYELSYTIQMITNPIYIIEKKSNRQK